MLMLAMVVVWLKEGKEIVLGFGLHAIGTRKVSKSLVTTTDPELDDFAAVALALRQVLLALFCQLQTRKAQQRFWVQDYRNGKGAKKSHVSKVSDCTGISNM